MVALIAEARLFKPGLRAAFVVNRRVVGTVIGREVRSALAALDLPVVDADIAQRVIFAESVAGGQVVRESRPHCAATREIAHLTRAVLTLP